MQNKLPPHVTYANVITLTKHDCKSGTWVRPYQQVDKRTALREGDFGHIPALRGINLHHLYLSDGVSVSFSITSASASGQDTQKRQLGHG